MAFDQPIEADRIDDFNLISAFVRAPLWILGGVLGSKSSSSKDEDEDDAALPPKRLDDDMYDDERSENFSPNVNYYGSSSSSSYMATTTTTKAQSSASSRPPSMVSSSFSSSSSTASSSHSYSSFLASSSRDSNNSKHKTKKTMSWSDESGQSLCEYATAEVSYLSYVVEWIRDWMEVKMTGVGGLRRNYISMVSFLPLQTNKLLNLEQPLEIIPQERGEEESGAKPKKLLLLTG